MNTKSTIFGLDSKGNLKVKHFKAEGDLFITTYGRYGGKMTESIKKCHDKNVGKSNESLASDQAIQMVLRGVTKDTEQNGYMVVPDSIQEEGESAIVGYISSNLVDDTPMLAYPYKEGKSDWKNGVMCSRKLDGIRCIAVYRNGELSVKSRKGKPITTMKHIEKDLLPEMKAYCDRNNINELRLDGELYNHKYKDDFEDLVSAIKKYQPGVSELLEYHVYGLIDLNKTAIERYYAISSILSTLDEYSPVKVVEQIEIKSLDLAWQFHKTWTNDGYEGAMLLNSNSLYRQTRTYDLMKLKVFRSEEFEIIDVIPMEARPDLGMIVLKTPEGKQFKSTPKCTEEKKAWYLQNKDSVIGKQGTVQFFSMTKAGVPRLPVFISVRDYE